MASSSRMHSILPICRRFFKVMMGDFHTRLAIPIAFCKQPDGKKSNEAILTSRQGSWEVKINECTKGCFYFDDGWGSFVQEHDLNAADILEFEHKGNMHFAVFVYGPSACEEDFPLMSSNDEMRVLVELENDKHSERGIDHCLGRIQPIELSTYVTSNPNFVSTINATNGLRSYMALSLDFVKKTGITRQSTVTLRDPLGNFWPMKVNTRTSSSKLLYMGDGWRGFYTSNKLKIGDVCIFELTGTTDFGAFLIDVLIFPGPI